LAPGPLEPFIHMAKKIRSDNTIALTEIYDKLFSHFGPQHWWPGDSAFEVAVGAILTQNTNWGNVEKAISNIKAQKALNANILHNMPHTQLASLIKPAGYLNVKAKRLKAFLDFMVHDFRGSMQRMKKVETDSLRKSLLSVNGIGPETADSILLYALDKPVFVIDTYTKRVMSRHGLVSDSVDYHELQGIFHKHLPLDVQLFNEYHALFVMAGKNYCKPKPKCTGCPLEGI
jgi:endonuclease-3 related protein